MIAVRFNSVSGARLHWDATVDGSFVKAAADDSVVVGFDPLLTVSGWYNPGADMVVEDQSFPAGPSGQFSDVVFPVLAGQRVFVAFSSPASYAILLFEPASS